MEKQNFIKWIEKTYSFINSYKNKILGISSAYDDYCKDLRIASNIATDLVKEVNTISDIDSWKNSKSKYEFWTYLIYQTYKKEKGGK